MNDTNPVNDLLAEDELEEAGLLCDADANELAGMFDALGSRVGLKIYYLLSHLEGDDALSEIEIADKINKDVRKVRGPLKQLLGNKVVEMVGGKPLTYRINKTTLRDRVERIINFIGAGALIGSFDSTVQQAQENRDSNRQQIDEFIDQFGAPALVALIEDAKSAALACAGEEKSHGGDQ